MVDLRYQSVVEMFHDRVAESGDGDAMYGRKNGDWYTISWREAGDRVRRIACGLLSIGIESGERCSILCVTRPEWVLADIGILAAGAATTTIYPSNTPEECAYILQDSGSVVCIAENDEMAAKLLEVRAEIPHVRQVVVIDGSPNDDGWVITLDDLERRGEEYDEAHPDAYERVTSSVGPDDLATLIYTSGTTGQPKGVMLNHSNWVYEAEATASLGLLTSEDLHYLFLPLAHSFAKVLECLFIRSGTPTACDGSVDDLVENLGHIKPTVMAGVPRIFEKVYNKVITSAKEAGGLKYTIFTWAVGVGREVSQIKQDGGQPSGLLGVKASIADKLVFSKLKDRFGGRIRFFVSGGAPLSREIAEFFHAADLLVLEGYGLTETSAAAFINREDHYKFGTVGAPVPGTQVKIAEADGEILIKGGGVMQGYYNRPDATAETLNPEGWLHTGDIGTLDSDGFLTITDRKKDIIVTAGGKNIAPQNIENMLKVQCPFVSQVVMLGDKKPFCIALITINDETVGKWAGDNGLSFSDYSDLASKPEVHQLIWDAVETMNSELASYETIKKIALLDHDLTIESGELTPKMSVKRKVVEANNADLIAGFYEGTLTEM